MCVCGADVCKRECVCCVAQTHMMFYNSGRFPQMSPVLSATTKERWGAGVETQKNVREEIGGWGRVPFNEPYAPSLSTIYDGA